jgi:RNA-directed DNA polymerase
MARKRCWKYDWCIDYDIKGFFDNLDHSLVMKAVKCYTDSKWVLLYVERWLKAPMQKEDGTLIQRDKGTPQGGVISPLFANIFMHFAFDEWMRRTFPYVPFERYADDGIVHCLSYEQANEVLEAMKQRLQECGLEIHPDKTRIVYCKDDRRKKSHGYESFDFLGFTFRPRLSKSKWGKYFVGFIPAISQKAAKAIRVEIRSWKLQSRSDKQIDDLARMFNAQVQGWINYYGAYYKSALYPTLREIETDLVLWVKRKYKRLQGHHIRAIHWLGRIARREPKLFAHWRFGLTSTVGKMGAV